MAVPFFDDIISQIPDRLQDRNNLDLFALLPSVMSSNEATEFFLDFNGLD